MKYYFKYKRLFDLSWKLIFYHNLKGGFYKENEVGSISTEYKFSALKELSALSTINGKYEFLLEYPGIGYIHWQQDVNPISMVENTTNGNDIGLVVKHTTEFTKFRGLLVSTLYPSYTYLDGSAASLSNYRYSIATIRNDRYYGIPGPSYTNSDAYADECFLWIRIPDIKSCKISEKIKFIHFIFVTFIIS